MPPKFKRHMKDQDVLAAQAHERVNLLGEYHDDEDGDEDDFFLNQSPVSRQGDGKIQKVQRQVDEVVDIMKDNVDKVLDRGEKLEDLQEKSDELVYSASMFRVSAKGLRSHFWWQECKMRLILLAVVLIILLVIFIPIILKTQN
ncbi:vesicle-associated membrane protein 3-like [Amphiura filiformis]|uniref:vesicle-associated membrane protein 3-like n=1 Tax=Amphiura filiformis TaxID=82378 RepID=UPI003B20BA6F